MESLKGGDFELNPTSFQSVVHLSQSTNIFLHNLKVVMLDWNPNINSLTLWILW